MPKMTRLLVVSALLAVLGGASPLRAQQLPEKHDSRHWAECRRCRGAYQRAMEHTLTRLPRASFPAKMIMGWLLLADGGHPKELDQVLQEAARWESRVGEKKPHNHRRNWYPALAGVLIAEHAKFAPSRETRESLQGIIDHFVAVQEQTGGWFKWYEGAYKDRLDYPVKDLGILDAIILGLMHTARAQGVNVPAESLARAEACVAKLLGGGGISYGTGSGGGDTTGARGAFAMNGLLYAGLDDHPIPKAYARILPQRIPNLQKGHHVGGLHGLGVAIGCHLLGPEEYRKLTDRWLDPLIDLQQPDGGVYIGDDEDAGGEVKLLGEDDASTAAFALLILLQDPARLRPGVRPDIDWLALDLPPPPTDELARVPSFAARGQLDKALTLIDRVLQARNTLDQAAVQDAERLKIAIEAHARHRLDEAVASLSAGDVLHALEILEPLAKTLARHPLGMEAKAQVARVQTDPALKNELRAQKELEKAWKAAAKNGLAKAIASFERVLKRYPGTAAARQASEILE